MTLEELSEQLDLLLAEVTALAKETKRSLQVSKELRAVVESCEEAAHTRKG